MKNLIYKELILSINKFFYILPILLAFLMFIPGWLFMIVFMYFFWITMPQVYVTYLSQRDYAFTVVLPVSKADIAKSKGYTLILLELYHFGLGLIFGIVHNMIYGVNNFFLDLNPAFFGIVLIMFAIFNIIFLPEYFKTAYKYGKPLIVGIVATIIFGLGLEVLNLLVKEVNVFLENPNIIHQILILVTGIITFIMVNYIALNKSARNYEMIK